MGEMLVKAVAYPQRAFVGRVKPVFLAESLIEIVFGLSSFLNSGYAVDIDR